MKRRETNSFVMVAEQVFLRLVITVIGKITIAEKAACDTHREELLGGVST